ncbi:MAG: cystathionine gamma-synthase [Fimbriimonadales bacterium]|jgi:cystathionine gamma-lyase|nr:cystathionine gamma-synthase [Fimbriimonadales bacterium]GIV13951.1 MAG: cystathionine beta-lyase [Fimbriimonadales bacterium]CUU03149.1 cystathionine gamma-lyase [Armatimonadetes bacterium GBS]CUU34958.1 cystathionine gamma-lyase [Armatimonadetes bacterium GXS]
MRFATRAIHAGIEPDPTTGAIMTPVYLTSTYVQEAPGKHKGYEYSRSDHPTRAVLERNLAALEGVEYGLAFASGLAAENTILNLLQAGDHVLATQDLYGGTYRLFQRVWAKFGLEFSFVSGEDPDEVRRALKSNTKLLWIETPSNPLLNIVDIRALSEVAHERGVLVVVDNTFATPYLQRPIELGADIVVHSTTKYLGGHSDVVGGALCIKDRAIYEQLKFYQNAVGAVPGPLDCFLVLRGIKTLALRMRQHCENAQRIAEYLAQHPEVERVLYPGLPTHPGHGLAKRQMDGFGGMVSLVLKGGMERALRFMRATRLFKLAESLGGVESLMCHPATMTHASIPPEERARIGISDTLIRLSVGIEDAEDLIEDIEQALQASR